ncbi:MAG: hypothetical protein FJ033_12075 [Chloroflexi bacterium]|nr:hypothetical protein [Chloroflexota bacterium]
MPIRLRPGFTAAGAAAGLAGEAAGAAAAAAGCVGAAAGAAGAAGFAGCAGAGVATGGEQAARIAATPVRVDMPAIRRTPRRLTRAR